MNKNRPKGNQKHIDLSGRIRIEQGLNNGESFRTIARDLNKDSRIGWILDIEEEQSENFTNNNWNK